MTIPKRTPEEWITVVRVGGTTKTVFTEGPTDARLIWVASGLKDSIDCRSAKEIDFDPSTTAFVGGNKGRVIAINNALSGLPPSSASAVAMKERARCLVDADYNVFFPPDEKLKGGGVLVVTDFSNLISCIVSHDAVRKCTTSAFGWTPSMQTWMVCTEALAFAFSCRFRNASLDLGLRAPEISSYFRRVQSSIQFDKGGYLHSYFSAQGNAANALRAEIEAATEQVDVMYMANSNDLVAALYKLCRLDGKIGGAVNREQFRSVLLTAVPTNLGADSEVKQLLEWLHAV